MNLICCRGDPTVFEPYWRKAGERCSITFKGDQCLSYLTNPKALCWFMEPKLEEEIKKVHRIVGNAKVDDHHLVVGNGSSQLILAALYALCSPNHHTQPHPIDVVSAAPYYSTYQEEVDLLCSALFRWAGDAHQYDNKDEPYIELITSPNNPNGVIREPVVNRPGGRLIHDLAYYWPQYTAITSQLDHDIMLFTASKCTGHAGSRIGWALVRDEEVAKKMVKFIEVNSIGVSKESQLRTAKILSVASESCQEKGLNNFFLYGRHVMANKWKKLREIVKKHQRFIIPKYPLQYCQFSKDYVEASPAYAWMSCKFENMEDQDCEKILKDQNVIVRSGSRFGSDSKHARVSMLSREDDFNVFLQRLSAISKA
ncbi:OLC1v1028370C2 [Oldenlandia corymbosa var. corymbosa]|uniref:OLC1v1028370C2 n=1 Tax=Oldenlandia corymbosa var. corymbosa TaxID=529605 RepID=A0AAV1CEF1_OLDCO|nr:OLC1v1028370C2 [Oldenlandia corymbosa var. corymbosa]